MKQKKFTRFLDMHSGGFLKTSYSHIYIDEPLGEAIKTFKEILKHDPDNITCDCCGTDFVYEEYESLDEATAYDRGCEWNIDKYDLTTAKISIDNFFREKNNVLLIKDNE